MRGPVKVCRGDVEGFLSQTLSIGPRAGQPSPHPLGDALPLELRQGGENMQLEPSRRRLQVDAFPEGYKPYSEGLELVEQRDEVLEAAPQAVQAPHDDGIHRPALGVAQQAIKGGAAIRGPADAVVDVLDAGPASCLDEPPQLLQLVLRLLVERADPGVDRGPHHSTPDSRNEW